MSNINTDDLTKFINGHAEWSDHEVEFEQIDVELDGEPIFGSPCARSAHTAHRRTPPHTAAAHPPLPTHSVGSDSVGWAGLSRMLPRHCGAGVTYA